MMYMNTCAGIIFLAANLTYVLIIQMSKGGSQRH